MQSIARADAAIGRTAELARLAAILGQVRLGRPRIVVLSGEAGIGKSHLLRALIASTGDGEFRVGVGHGQEGVSIPFMVASEVLRVDATAEGPARTPALHDVTERVLELATRQPLLLAIDDFQWADADSKRLFVQLGFALSDAALRRSAPILLALVTRPLDPSESPAPALLRLMREPICQRIDLQGLDLLDTAALLRMSGLTRPTPAAAQSVFEITAGNPLFIKGLAAQVSRQEGSENAAELLAARLAPDLRAVVAAQIDAATPEQLRLLRRAALIGQRFSLELLARAAAADLEPVLDAIEGAPELVRCSGEQAEFAHPLIRHELVQRMPAALRAELHASIAAALLLDHAGEVAPADPALAHHLLAAGERVDRAQVLAVARRTADRLEAQRAFADAARMHEAAAEREPEIAARAELWFRGGVCWQRNYDAAASLRAFDQAQAAFDVLGDLRGIARTIVERARVELYAAPLGRLRDVSPITAALDALPAGEEVLAGWLHCALADAYFYARKSDEGERHARLALAIGELHRDHRLCRYACIPLALAQGQAMRYVEAEQSTALGLRHACALGDERLEVVPHVRHAGVLHALGRTEDAATECAAAIAAAARTSEPGEEALALAQSVSLQASRGAFDEAEETAQALVRMLGRVDGRPWAPLLGIPALAYVRHARGRSDDACVALQSLREAGRWVDRIGGAEHVLATSLEDLIAADEGAPKDDERTAARRARVERFAGRISPRTIDGMGLGAACALAELAGHYQLPWALEGPHAALERAFEGGAVFSTGWPFLIARVLANAELTLGRAERADHYFEVAIEVAARIGALPELARARVDYARAQLARGGNAAERRALELLVPALDDLARLGMQPLFLRAHNLAAALGGRPTPSRAPASSAPRTDVQMLLQLAGSEASADVARRYLLSQRGMRDRAADVLASVGARRPLELAPYVFEHELVPPPRIRSGTPLVLMVTDLEGFTPLVERLGDEHAQQLIREHNMILRAHIRDHSGLEITHTGDGVIASFGTVAEAASCAIAIQRELAARNQRAQTPLRVRVGLHVGEPLLEEGRLFGASVIAAVRICAECEAGHILASSLVETSASPLQFRFVRYGSRTLKGFSDATELYDIRWQSRDTPEPPQAPS